MSSLLFQLKLAWRPWVKSNYRRTSWRLFQQRLVNWRSWEHCLTSFSLPPLFSSDFWIRSPVGTFLWTCWVTSQQSSLHSQRYWRCELECCLHFSTLLTCSSSSSPFSLAGYWQEIFWPLSLRKSASFRWLIHCTWPLFFSCLCFCRHPFLCSSSFLDSNLLTSLPASLANLTSLSELYIPIIFRVFFSLIFSSSCE